MGTSSRKFRKFWTAAATFYREEERAAHHVERLGHEFYLPRVMTLREITRRHRPLVVDVRELLFPGYIMIRVGETWRDLTRAGGVRELFMDDELPLRMRDDQVQRLRDMEDETGHVRLTPRLESGQIVRVGEGGGAYAGQTGVVQDATALSRVRVQFEKMLGRSPVGTFDERVLVAA